MSDPARKRMTIDEFFAWAEGTDPESCWELVDGEPRAMMTPPLQEHGQVAANLTIALGRRLRAPCRVLAETGIVRPDRTDLWYQADVAVTCKPFERRKRWTPDPVFVAEILSDSTATHDRGNKLPDYCEIPSMREILLLDTRMRRAQLWRRDGGRWIVEDYVGRATVPVACLDLELPLDELYEHTGL